VATLPVTCKEFRRNPEIFACVEQSSIQFIRMESPAFVPQCG
jgi:hypothetical protein